MPRVRDELPKVPRARAQRPHPVRATVAWTAPPETGCPPRREDQDFRPWPVHRARHSIVRSAQSQVKEHDGQSVPRFFRRRDPGCSSSVDPRIPRHAAARGRPGRPCQPFGPGGCADRGGSRAARTARARAPPHAPNDLTPARGRPSHPPRVWAESEVCATQDRQRRSVPLQRSGLAASRRERVGGISVRASQELRQEPRGEEGRSRGQGAGLEAGEPSQDQEPRTALHEEAVARGASSTGPADLTERAAR